jgi:hypothetical protein
MTRAGPPGIAIKSVPKTTSNSRTLTVLFSSRILPRRQAKLTNFEPCYKYSKVGRVCADKRNKWMFRGGRAALIPLAAILEPQPYTVLNLDSAQNYWADSEKQYLPICFKVIF